jgi:hypothetical protein
MREFLWGMVLGALVVLFYANYGDNLQAFRRYTLQWRDWAVKTSDHYSAGHEPKK